MKVYFIHGWRKALAELSGLSPTVRHVGLTWSLWADADGSHGRPGADRLAAATGLSVKTIRVSLGSLVAAGWLVLTEEGGVRGVRRANEYRAVIPRDVRFTGEPLTPVTLRPVGGREVPPTSSITKTVDSSLSDGTTPGVVDNLAGIAASRERLRAAALLERSN